MCRRAHQSCPGMRQISALGFCFLSEPPVKSLCSSTGLCNLTPLMTRQSCQGRHQHESLRFSLLCRWPAGQTETSRVSRTAAPRTSLSLRPPCAGPAPAQCAAPRVVARRTLVSKPNRWPLSRAGASPRGGGSTCRGRERRPQLWLRYFGEATLGRQRASG